MVRKTKIWRKSIIYSILSSLSLIFLYLIIVSLFQGLNYAIGRFVEFWYLMTPLVIGFGVQVGLFIYIRNFMKMSTGTTGACGGISMTSMVACCVHHVTDVMPILGVSAVGVFLLQYQPVLLAVGIVSNIVGIISMINLAKKNRVKFNIDRKVLLQITFGVVLIVLIVVFSFLVYQWYKKYVGYRKFIATELNDKCTTPPGYTDGAWREHMSHHPDRYKECLGG
ncbi:MAG: hypothetical protein QW818_02285 [Candidatus Aenigmatarchaeota archaeon]